MQNTLFFIFASVALLSAMMVVTAKNPVRAVLSLILTFLSTAAIWLMLDAEFLAITLILVYVGAVMVLFLFVVMMLDIDFAVLKAKFSKWLPVGLGLALAFLVVLFDIIENDQFAFSDSAPSLAYGRGESNVTMLGNLIFTKYLLQFEIAGVLLLVAVIAAIGLIYKGPRNRKIQNVAEQISVNSKSRIRLVDGDA